MFYAIFKKNSKFLHSILYIPSMNDSGYFVLARWMDEDDKTDLEITAFKVT